MTPIEPKPPAGHEPCEECGAAMDPHQRYCVNCAARRGNGANPSSRYFAAMSTKARRPLTAPKKENLAAPASRAAAVGFFALLPIAVALGVLVGRSDSGSSDNEALLQALSAQEATAAIGTDKTASATSKTNAAKPGKSSTKGEGKVTNTSNGAVHEVTSFKASKEKEETDTKLVEENPEQVGADYITAQQNLPDVIVVGGDGGAAPTNGAEP